jgi:hypothetical protein
MFKQIKDKLQVPFYMKILILMAWSIWTTRNDWIFKDIDRSVERCKGHFVREINLLFHRVKPELAAVIDSWLHFHVL